MPFPTFDLEDIAAAGFLAVFALCTVLICAGLS